MILSRQKRWHACRQSVWVCLCVWVCVYYLYMCVCTCLYVCTCVSLCVQVCVCVWVSVSACVWVHICVCVCVCVCTRELYTSDSASYSRSKQPKILTLSSPPPSSLHLESICAITKNKHHRLRYHTEWNRAAQNRPKQHVHQPGLWVSHSRDGCAGHISGYGHSLIPRLWMIMHVHNLSPMPLHIHIPRSHWQAITQSHSQGITQSHSQGITQSHSQTIA